MIMMRLDETAARGYTACFCRFSNFDGEENPLFSLRAIAAFILITHSNYRALQHAILHSHTSLEANRISKTQDSSARHIVYITKIEWTS